jgi:oligopeptide/dipeptide ABC transporter ATP-binding protein
MSATNKPLLKVDNLKKYFPIKRGFFSRTVGHVKAVDDVSFTIGRNETLGIVGESGCGKTTVGRTILRLLEPTAGSAEFDGQQVFELKSEALRKLRPKMQIIFQDPYSSLNPRMTVDSLIGDAMTYHGLVKPDERRARIKDLLVRVGLQPSYINRYPHEFSGGQRQRIGIARAVALNPDLIVCDEAVSALDVSVQAQIINLLEELQEEYNLSYMFIAHDLSVVKHISDRVAVMYLGQIVELSDCEALYENTLHPYAQALLSAIPHPVPGKKKNRIILKGDVPSPINPPGGCRFHTRCPARFKPCDTVEPKLLDVDNGHMVKCHLYDPAYQKMVPDGISQSFLVDLAKKKPAPAAVEPPAQVAVEAVSPGPAVATSAPAAPPEPEEAFSLDAPAEGLSALELPDAASWGDLEDDDPKA